MSQSKLFKLCVILLIFGASLMVHQKIVVGQETAPGPCNFFEDFEDSLVLEYWTQCSLSSSHWSPGDTFGIASGSAYSGSLGLGSWMSSGPARSRCDSVIFMTGEVSVWFKGNSGSSDIRFQLLDTTELGRNVKFQINPHGTDNEAYRLRACDTTDGYPPDYSEDWCPIPNRTWFKATIEMRNNGEMIAYATAPDTAGETLSVKSPACACSPKQLAVAAWSDISVDSITVDVDRLAPISFRDSALSFSAAIGETTANSTKFYNPGCSEVDIDSVIVSEPFSFIWAESGVAAEDSGSMLFTCNPMSSGDVVDTAKIYYSSLQGCPVELILTGEATSCSTYIDSVWFSEETECNDSNIVELCYSLSSHFGESTFTISTRMSDDFGETWSVPLTSLADSAGDLGLGVTPGVHCFNWIMSEDYPGHEGCQFTFEVVSQITSDVCLLVDSVDLSEIVSPFTSFYPAGLTKMGDSIVFSGYCREVYVINSEMDRLETSYSSMSYPTRWEGIAYDGENLFMASRDAPNIYKIDPSDGSVLDESGRFPSPREHGDGLTYDAGRNCLWISWHDWRLDKIDPESLTILESFILEEVDSGSRANPEGLTMAYGKLFFVTDPTGKIGWLDIEHTRGDTVPFMHMCTLPGSADAPEDLAFNGTYILYANSSNHKIYTIQLYADSSDTVDYTNCLDSRSPAVSLGCPTEIISAGDTLDFNWDIDDLFWVNDECSLFISYCGEENRYLVTDTSFEWVSPYRSCDSVSLRLSVRDSFCNWGYDTCSFTIIGRDTLTLSLPDTAGYPSDTLLIPITLNTSDSLLLSDFQCSINYDSETITIYDLVTSGSATDRWSSVSLDTSSPNKVILEGNGSILFLDSILCFLKVRVLDETSGYEYSGMNFSSIEIGREEIITFTKDGFLIVNPKDIEWYVPLTFDGVGFKEDANIGMGSSFSGSEGYDPGLDEVSLPPLTRTKAWFILSDSAYPYVEELSRDIRSAHERSNCWTIETREAPGELTWDPDRLPMGNFILDDSIYMRSDSSYNYSANETLQICYNRPLPSSGTIKLTEGWNLMSFPVIPAEREISEVVPGLLGATYFYDASERRYISTTEIYRGEAYWIYSRIDTSFQIAGMPVNWYTKDVIDGWNLIGSVTDSVSFSSVEFSPASHLINQYEYSGGSYSPSSQIIPGKGYWILVSDSARMRVNCE